MKDLIERIIIAEIPAGAIFDAHAVIEILKQKYTDSYLSFHSNGETTEHFHSKISKAINSFDGRLISRIPADSLSKNIRDNFTTNACWRKNR